MPDQIGQLKSAGFSDQEIGDWATGVRSQLTGAGFNDDEVNAYLGGGVPAPTKVSQPFLERLKQGSSLSSLWTHLQSGHQKAEESSYLAGPNVFAQGAKEGFDTSAPHIFSESFENDLRAAGVIPDPQSGRAGPLRFMNEAMLRPIGGLFDLIGRGVSAGVSGAAETIGETVKRLGGPSEQAKREVQNFANYAMVDSPARGEHLMGIGHDLSGRPIDTPLSGVPKTEDFTAAAKGIIGDAADTPFQQKLRSLYEDKGLLPAEVARDAESDVTVSQDLASRTPKLPERYQGEPALETPEKAAERAEPLPRSSYISALTTGPVPQPTLPTNIPNGIFNFAPSDLTVDADRFQFKSGGDESGVTDRLRGVETWDPIKAGVGLVWEDENGQKFIVDGHQRLGLARRIEEEDPAQQPRLNAVVVRQGEGVSDVEARVIAASKNIAEGTGTPLDAAKILRDVGPEELAKTLPPRSELVRQARGLAELGDDPFRMVVNDVVPPNYGAIVGRLAPDNPELQSALINLLSKTEPANAVQAEAIVRQGIDAGTRAEKQATLFGDEDVVSSLYTDRAKVLDRVLRQLKQDRLVFGSIVRDQDVIEAVGNRLESSANANRAAADTQAVQILQVLANRRGPLSDALSAAARRSADGDAAGAVREFVAAVRTQAERGDLVRSADGLERSRGDAGAKNAANAVDPSRTEPGRNAEDRATESANATIAATYERSPGKLRLLQRGRDVVENTEDYDVRGADGRELGINMAVRLIDKTAEIIDIAGPGAGYLGPRTVRTLARQFFEEHPGIDTITGFRATGARLAQEPSAPKPMPNFTATREQVMGPAERPAEPPRPPAAGQELVFGPETGAISWAPPPPRTPLDEARESVLNKLSVNEPGPRRKMTLSRLYTNIFDRLYPISEATPADLATSQNPYRLSRLLSGLAGKIDHMLSGPGTFDWKTYTVNGKSFEQVLAPVKDDLDNFRAFGASARALELEGRGIQAGFDVGAARMVVRSGIEKYGPPLEELIDYQNRIAAYLRDSGVLSRAGYEAMTQTNQLFVPFQRVMGDGDHFHGGSGQTLQASNPIQRIKGSERDVIDIIESIIRNTALLVTMAEKNAVGIALVDTLLREGELGRLGAQQAIKPIEVPPDAALDAALKEYLEKHGVEKPEGLLDLLSAAAKPPPDEGTISVFRDGTRYTYQVDPELARAMKGLDAATAGLLEKVLAPFARTLRAGAVLAPDFAERHTIRDFLYAFTTYPTGIFTPADMVRGFMGLISKDEDYWRWLQGGGANISNVVTDRRYLQEDIARLTQQTGLMTRALNVVIDPNATWLDRASAVAGLPFKAAQRYVIRPLQVLTELAENASHLGAFKKAMREMEPGEEVGREDIQHAAWISRDVAVDAARIGAKTRAYNMVTAFANITLQDSDRVVRAFVNDPVGTSLKVGAGIVVPSALLWWAQRDDPRYKELADWQKDMFWIVMTDKWEDAGPASQYGPPSPGTPYRIESGRLQVNNGAIFRIPKPWGMGVLFGSGTERALEAFAAEKPDAFEHWAHSISHSIVPQFFPTAVAPILNQWTNRDTFTNRTLIPDRMEKWMPEYQYTPYTTEASKALGRLVGAFPGLHDLSLSQDAPVAGGVARALTSPMLIENYIRGWGGGLGMYALEIADYSLRKQGILPDPPKPTSALADIPVIKAFVVRYPSATTESIQNFEDRYATNKIYYDTWMAKAKEGDAVAAAAIYRVGGPRMFVQLDQIKKTLGEQNKLIQDIYRDPSSSPSDKRQLIDTIYYRMIELGQAGKAALDTVDAQIPRTIH